MARADQREVSDASRRAAHDDESRFRRRSFWPVGCAEYWRKRGMHAGGRELLMCAERRDLQDDLLAAAAVIKHEFEVRTTLSLHAKPSVSSKMRCTRASSSAGYFGCAISPFLPARAMRPSSVFARSLDNKSRASAEVVDKRVGNSAPGIAADRRPALLLHLVRQIRLM